MHPSRPRYLDAGLTNDEVRSRLGRDANLPLRHERHADVLEDTGMDKRWLRIRDKLVSQAGSGYLIGLLGKRGTGKTQMAVQLALHRIGIRQTVLYTDAMDIFLWIRSAYGDDAKLNELVAISEFVSPSLLVIDEASERGESAWEDRLLVYLLNKRYNYCQDTILIANLTAGEFSETLGPSIVDRIRETGALIECDWEPKRAAARERFGNENTAKKGSDDENN